VFNSEGQRAVDLLLLSAAACLNFYLVEYASARGLTVHTIHVSCDGTLQKHPERLERIVVKVTLDGELTERERHKMLVACERACKVMNTLRTPPICEVVDATPPRGS